MRYPSQEEGCGRLQKRHTSRRRSRQACKRGTAVGGGHGRLQRRHGWHVQQRRHFKEAAPHFRTATGILHKKAAPYNRTQQESSTRRLHHTIELNRNIQD